MGILHRKILAVLPHAFIHSNHLLRICNQWNSYKISILLTLWVWLSKVSTTFLSSSQDEGFTHGASLPDDFKLWLNRHPGLTFDEALHRFRDEQKAKLRQKGPKLH